MNSGGIVLIIAGIWLITQVCAGDMLGRLDLL
jgi:hypothetical protein